MAIYSIRGRDSVWKRKGGGLREEKVEIVKTCIHKKRVVKAKLVCTKEEREMLKLKS